MSGKNKLTFRINEKANRITWSVPDLPLKNEENADFWRIHIDDGFSREIMVKSSQQEGKVRTSSNETIIHYDGLTDVYGKTYNVRLNLHMEDKNDVIECWADVENLDDVRINEVQFPFMDLSAVCDENRANDVLYRPRGLGERINNPWAALENDHTEYMAADYNEIWSPLFYPRPASMAWFGIESSGHFLYIGRHDDKKRICTLLSGINPRNKSPRIISAICHYPAAVKGEFISCGHSVLTLQKGDWRIGSDIYGDWARKTFYNPAPKPEWVQNMTGWQRIILKHQYGEIFWKYEDLPRVYKEGAEYGLDTLLIFGWWKGRFDNGYPIYEPDPDLGGAEALKKAIEEIHNMGGRAILYTNGVLIDRATDYYKETGHRICRIDIDGNEYQEHYQFANNGTILRNFGYKTFVSACQATDEWREKLLENGRIKLSFNPDSIFYDQIGGHKCWPCFNSSHKHRNRIDEDPWFRCENLKAMHDLCTGDKALGSENTVDVFSCIVDYNHGCDFGNWYRRRANDPNARNNFPKMYRRTFPETIMTNRFIHDCRKDFKDELNFAFIHGYRFDVSIYRGRVAGIAGEPEYAKYIKKLIDLRKAYHQFFYHGKYVVDTDITLPDKVHMAEYTYENRKMFAFWNENKNEIDIDILGNTVHIGANDVACIVTL